MYISGPPLQHEGAFASGPVHWPQEDVRIPINLREEMWCGDIHAGDRPVQLDSAHLKGAIVTNAGAVRLSGDKGTVTPQGDQRCAIWTDSGDIQAHPGSVIEGHVFSRTGNITLAGSSVTGDVAQAPISATAVDLEARGTRQPTLTLEGTQVTGRVQGERMMLRDVRADQVVLDGARLGSLMAEARLDVHGALEVKRIIAAGPALVVWHGRRPTQLKVDASVRHVVLGPLDGMPRLVALTAGLDDLPDELSLDGWRQLQHGLEVLLSDSMLALRDGLAEAGTRRALMQLVTERGDAAANALLRWMETSPGEAFEGLRQLGRLGLERTCAVLGRALMRDTLDLLDRADRKLLETVGDIADHRETRWSAICRHLAHLEGRHLQTGEPWQPEPLAPEELAAAQEQARGLAIPRGAASVVGVPLASMPAVGAPLRDAQTPAYLANQRPAALEFLLRRLDRPQFSLGVAL